MNVELISYTNDPENTIVKAARICYDSKSKDLETDKKFIKSLIKSGHTSTIEHASATFMISGISRALSHQLVRHRLASYSQRSQRYVKENEPSYMIPPEIEKNIELKIKYDSLMTQIWDTYKYFLKNNIRAESARMVLPNACFTQICMTANFREWRNFLQLRLSPRAQYEIRELANIILDQLLKIAPNCFEDLKLF